VYLVFAWATNFDLKDETGERADGFHPVDAPLGVARSSPQMLMHGVLLYAGLMRLRLLNSSRHA
jgi:hypothetical protein